MCETTSVRLLFSRAVLASLHSYSAQLSQRTVLTAINHMFLKVCSQDKCWQLIGAGNTGNLQQISLGTDGQEFFLPRALTFARSGILLSQWSIRCAIYAERVDACPSHSTGWSWLVQCRFFFGFFPQTLHHCTWRIIIAEWNIVPF